MNVSLALRVVAMIALAFCACGAGAQTTAAQSTTTRLIVKLRETGLRQPEVVTTARLDRVAADAAGAGVTLSRLRTMALGAHVMTLDRRLPRAAVEALATRLAQNPDVEYVQADYRRHASRTPSDPRFSSQWYLTSASGSVDAVDAWDVTTGSPSVIVAVVDTGYRPHPDLAGRVLPGYDFVSDPKIANDGGGRDADATDPGDWVDASDLADPEFSDCKIEDSAWHGTAVAGLIAADSDNSLWVTGIDWAAKLLPVRVLGKCGGYDSDILDGIAWAAGLAVPGAPANPYPAQVINLSLGGDGACTAAYHSVLSSALAHGVTRAIVAAAGNESSDVSTNAPASCSEVIAVAATTRLGQLAGYSNYGTGVGVSGPGGELTATTSLNGITVLWNTGATAPGADTWAKVSGTSFSAPMVSGVASLALGLAPTLTATQLRALLVSSASPFPAGSDCTPGRCGSGIINARAAVLAAQAASTGASNYQGIWWNAPAGSEDGWGINFAHQDDTIFASWFTYDMTGRGWWLVMTAPKTGPNVYSGTLYETHGPAFNAVPWSRSAVTKKEVGTGTLTFADGNHGTFTYIVAGLTQTKPITRQVFGALPSCTWGALPNLALATNYQDLWWNAPAASEDGWGVNLNHEGNKIFATWFTYDLDGSPLWLVATADQTTNPAVYTGTFYRTAGARFDVFNPLSVTKTPVGSLTLTFANGNQASFDYTVQLAGMSTPASQTKTITRQIFAAPGTACQ